jgi:hypothetical protein
VIRPVSVACLVAAALGLGGCAARAGNGARWDCVAEVGTLPAGTDPAGLAGDYELRLVATRGLAAGTAVTGTIDLAVSPAGVRGAAALALDSVGAHQRGDVGSRDSAAPGVLAFPTDGMILLRLGADANRQGAEQPIEAAYTVLHVRRIGQDGFSGTWASGAERVDAEGHFCARRATR